MAPNQNYRPHLVWVRSNRGPDPQIWSELNEYTGKNLDILQVIPLTDQQACLSIDELAEMFPCRKDLFEW